MPVKILHDENNVAFVPFISLDAIEQIEGTSVSEMLDKKLEAQNIKAGNQITIDVDGNDITINNDASGMNIIDNLETEAPGLGSLDARQGKILKDSIPEIVNNLNTIDSTKALSAHQGYVLAGRSVPVGGASGQVLKKTNDNDYALEWGDAADPNAIVGDGSIMKIVELTYEEYLELEAANQLQDDTEYHINDWNENERTYLTPDDIKDIVAQTTEFKNRELRVSTNDATQESNIGAIHPITGQVYIYANDEHHGIYSTKWNVLMDASDEGIIFNGVADRAMADGNGNNIAATYQPKIYDSGWIYPTLENGWEAYDDGRPFKYRKIGEVVYLQGSVKNGTNKGVLFTMPAGFRPGTAYSNCPIRINGSEVGWFFVNYGGSGANGVVAIETSNPAGTSSFVECPMFNISYIAEA